MESSSDMKTGGSPPSSSSSSSHNIPNSTSPSATATTAAVIISPCAACKILRRRCTDKCILAPYFPPTQPHKFTTAHRVFGASNIIKMLQEIPEMQRTDAVSSMVYEASARIRDPIYGCAGAICQLQRQVEELQAEVAKARAEMAAMQCRQANLVALICMKMAESAVAGGEKSSGQHEQAAMVFHQQYHHEQPSAASDCCMDTSCFLDENNGLLASSWEPLWA